LVITLRLSRYPAPTPEERIKKWKLEQGIFQKDLAEIKEYTLYWLRFETYILWRIIPISEYRKKG
jgi:hypothetical protein